MSNGAVGEKKDSSIMYKILLVVLFLIVVGLTISIIVVNNNKTDGPDLSSYNYDLPEGMTEDDLSEEDKVTLRAITISKNPDAGVEEAEEYYDKVIDKANRDGDHNFAINIINKKLLFLIVEEDDCEKARNYLESIDDSMYSDAEKGRLQRVIDAIMIDCKTGEEDR